MVKYLKLLHLYLYVFSVAFFFFLLYPLFWFFSRKPERYETLNKLRVLLAALSSGMVGICYRIKRESKLDPAKTYIICSNHFSNLDITISCFLPGPRFFFMGKDELLKSPIFKIFFKTVDIPVNRDSKISSFRAFKKAEERLQQGSSLLIFPEGKIGDEYPPFLHPFKNGPFRLAIENKIPIVPVTIVDAWEKLWDDGLKYGSRPGICDICVHKPIETSKMSIDDADNLRDKVFEIINSKLNEAR